MLQEIASLPDKTIQSKHPVKQDLKFSHQRWSFHGIHEQWPTQSSSLWTARLQWALGQGLPENKIEDEEWIKMQPF